MKRASLVLVALFACGFASASPPSPATSPDAGLQRVTAEQLSEVSGEYKLTNGKILVLSSLDERLYVELNGNYNKKELLAAGENTFASRDGSIRVTFQPGDQQDKVHLSYLPGPSADSPAFALNDQRRLALR